MTEPTLLDSLLEPGNLSVVFQPVFRLSGGRWEVHLVESLTRGPAGTNMESAGVLFEYMRRKGREAAIDRVCASNALRIACEAAVGVPLSVNVHASTLQKDAEFPGFVLEALRQSGRKPEHFVVEIVEHAPAYGGPIFLRALEALRGAGVRIALDDVGLGQSNYRMMIETRPDYFKADRYLVDGCNKDPYRQAVLESLVSLARRFGSLVIAEGIEQENDLEEVVRLGIHLVQGYRLSPPVPASRIGALCET
jgi:EAL domain-containing protein (putative c-di-GMP-specific phosphodiesterase class I)